MASKKTVIVTGASQGIGAAVVQAFLGRGYNVAATSRSVSRAGFAPSPNVAWKRLIDLTQVDVIKRCNSVLRVPS
jgi:NAD(P)-dependent dehydrogenase (short-subunit alcohol dehydrogenase family)